MSLLEVTVYIACCALISSLAGQLLLSMNKAARERIAVSDAWISVCIGLQRIVADLKTVSADSWISRKKNSIIFRLESKEYAWLINKGRLVKLCGKFISGQWTERGVSVVLNYVDVLDFRFVSDSLARLIGVHIKLGVKLDNRSIKLETFVALRKEAV